MTDNEELTAALLAAPSCIQRYVQQLEQHPLAEPGPYREAAPAPEAARLTVELRAVGSTKRSEAHDLLLRAAVSPTRARSMFAAFAAGTVTVVRQSMIHALAAAVHDDQLWASLVRVRGDRS